MQLLLLFLFLFIAGAFLGWCIEVLFRRFVSAKKWVNPGFMKGPWLPLYGFGMVTMFLMCYLCVAFFPSSWTFYNPLGGLFGREAVSGPSWYDLIPILLMGLAMNLLEFIAGVIFIKGFKVKLWDYTNMKGNILGVVCPVFAAIWFMIAIIFYYGVNPFLYVLSTNVYTYMFGSNGIGAHFGFIFSLGVIYGVMIYDLVVSIGLFARVRRFALTSGIYERYENLKESFNASLEEAKKKMVTSLPNPHTNGKPSVLKEKIDEMIYIDPELEKHKPNNYDENGRPISIEDESKQK